MVKDCCKCLLCGEEFDEPDIDYDYVGEFWGTPAYEGRMRCPFCNSDDVVDLWFCPEEEDLEVEYDD